MAKIEKAFILAAGLGTRMKPLTDKIPKPLVKIGGVTLLERALDHLQIAGVTDVVINTHHLAGQIPALLQKRIAPKLTISHEPVLLDTAGGIAKMLQYFGRDPFYVVSGDGLWTDKKGESALERLAATWDPAKMDILILLQPVARMNVTHGVGDYNLLPDGRCIRSKAQAGTHMFTSIRINSPQIFKSVPQGPIPYLPLLDAAEKAGRLFALEHTGDWYHLSTPQDVADVGKLFAQNESAA